MKVAVLGDALLDVEVAGRWNGNCPEAPIPLFCGNRVSVLAGGAGNVANIYRDQRCTVTLYCDGPGQGDRTWIGQLFKQVCQANRIVWSNHSSVSLKVRGIDDHNGVASRIDSDTPFEHGSFDALHELYDDIKWGKYDLVHIADYQKGVVNRDTKDIIADIIGQSIPVVVDSKGKDYSLWGKATALTPNKPDAFKIFGTDDPCEIRDIVGCNVVYLTRGKDGVLMGCQDGMVEVGVPDDVTDVYCVGAGDAFSVGVGMALGKRSSYLEAGMMGVKVAQQYVGKPRKGQLR